MKHLQDLKDLTINDVQVLNTPPIRAVITPAFILVALTPPRDTRDPDLACSPSHTKPCPAPLIGTPDRPIGTPDCPGGTPDRPPPRTRERSLLEQTISTRAPNPSRNGPVHS